jgi:flagellar biosynthesis/type III secretory pathway chaperone
MKQDLLDFLKQLSTAQVKTLAVLQNKQRLLVKPEKEALDAILAEENAILGMMQQVIQRREEILTSARLDNMTDDSIETLCEHCFPQNFEIRKLIEETKQRTLQIRYVAYTNWTLSRKSIVHLSQMLEILGTHGQGKTTYKLQNGAKISGSAFVDRVA